MEASQQTDNEQLERVFLKFGLADSDEQLEVILKRYLPLVLLKLSSSESSIRTKVLELLTHINKRLKSREAVQVPVKELLQQLNDASLSSFVTNFTIIYIKTGYPRLNVEQKVELAPMLFTSVEGKVKTQQDILLRLLLTTLPCIKLHESAEKFKKLFDFEKHPQATKGLLDFCLDVMIMPYSLSLANIVAIPTRPVSAPTQQQQGTAASPGLSRNAIKRLVGDANVPTWSLEEVETIKVAILNFIKQDMFKLNDVVCHLIIGSSDTRHTVASNSDFELRKQLPSIDWNKPSLVLKLYQIYLGSKATSKKKNAPPDDKREASNVRMKLKLLTNMLRSKAVAECFPHNIQVVYDGLFNASSTKLEVLTLQFVQHIIESCDEEQLQKQSSLLLNAMQKTVKNEEMNEKTRSLGYSSIGRLASKLPSMFSNKLDLIQDLFQTLAQVESNELKTSIQGAISMMAPAFQNADQTTSMLLESLIQTSIKADDHYTRLVGVRYAGVVYQTDHISTRYQLILAAGDVKEEVSSEAKRLLSGSRNRENNSKQPEKLPKFSVMLKFLHEKARERLMSSERHVIGTRSMAFTPAAFQAAFSFLRRCMTSEAGSLEEEEEVESRSRDVQNQSPAIVKHIRKLFQVDSEASVVTFQLYTDLIFQYIKMVADPQIVYLLLELIGCCPESVPLEKLLKSVHRGDSSDKVLSERTTWLKSLTKHNRDDIRQHAAEIYSIVFRRSPNPNYAQLTKDLLQDYDSKNFEARHSSILLMGHVVGDWLKLIHSPDDNKMIVDQQDHAYDVVKQALLKLVTSVKEEKDSLLAGSACFAVGEVSRKSSLPLPPGVLPLDSANEEKSSENDESLTKFWVVQCLSSRINNNTLHALREKAVIALGMLPVGDGDFPHTEKVLEILLKSSEIKNAELHFTVGSAVCNAALGPEAPARINRWTGAPDTNEVFQDAEEQIDQSPDKDKLKWLLGKILNEYVVHRTPAGRQASCIWLMTMLKTEACTSHPAVKLHLMDLQNAFTALLSEPDDLTQDIASKGFGSIYDLGSEDQKKMLVDKLVGSLTGSSESKSPASKVRIIGSEGSSLFTGGSVQLGKAPDGSSLNTYKELCSLASDLNQPDLVYKFLHLANHHALWNSKKGAAFGFRSIAIAAREQLTPHLPQIVPRLYRYTFDPQTSVRNAMTSIWNVVAPDPIKTVDEYSLSILEDLLSNLTNKIWRTRQACCLALADLLKTGARRPDSDAGIITRRLPEIWSIILRVRDDVKESVRDACEQTCTVLKRVTIRTFDAESSVEADEKILSEILNILLKEGMTSSVSDVQKLSLKTLVEVSKVSGALIKPCIPQMIVALLEAMSGLEDPVLNYMHNRSGHVTQDALDWVRAEAARSSPLMETAMQCLKQCDSNVLSQLTPTLSDLTKRGVGVLTKAGCAHIITSLVSMCGNDLTPYAGKFIAALTPGLLDRSLAVRKVNSTSIGHLARVAKDATLEKTLLKMKQWYMEKDESNSKHASASVVYAIARHCPDALNRHSALVLPLAFYGMHEVVSLDGSKAAEKKTTETGTKGDDVNFALTTKEMWEAVWNEFTPGFETAVRLHLGEIVTLAGLAIQSQSWESKAQAAAAMSSVAKRQRPGTIVRPHLDYLMQALLSGLQGRTWQGKAKLLEGLRDVCVHCKEQLTMEEFTKAVAALFKESKRENPVYRLDAICCLSSVLEAHAVDKFTPYWEIVKPLLVKGEGDSSDSDDASTFSTKRSERKTAEFKTHERLLKFLPNAWCATSKQSKLTHYDDVLTTVASFATLSTYNVQLTALQCMAQILSSLFPTDGAPESEEFSNSKIYCIVTEAICTSLENLKFSSIREEALKCCEALFQLPAGKFVLYYV
ncbi:proteasome adapter and scaffold protein ECM29-like [Ciona intestinalis]